MHHHLAEASEAVQPQPPLLLSSDYQPSPPPFSFLLPSPSDKLPTTHTPAHHHVAEAAVVVQRNVAARNLGRKQVRPVIDVERVQRLEPRVVVADQGVDAQQADEREVAQHAQNVGLVRRVAVGGEQAANGWGWGWRLRG